MPKRRGKKSACRGRRSICKRQCLLRRKVTGKIRKAVQKKKWEWEAVAIYQRAMQAKVRILEGHGCTLIGDYVNRV